MCPWFTCRKLLAEASLDKLELEMAEKAFVKCSDYWGIQFVKQLHHLDVRLQCVLSLQSSFMLSLSLSLSHFSHFSHFSTSSFLTIPPSPLPLLSSPTLSPSPSLSLSPSLTLSPSLSPSLFLFSLFPV